MRHIQHSEQSPPYQLQQTNAANWDGFGGKAAVSASLRVLQKGLCAYCQIFIDTIIGSHIEHIWPKYPHSEKTFQWDNLVLSCTPSEKIRETRSAGGVSCGHSNGKRDWSAYDPRFISPTEADCERYFKYSVSNGTVQPADGLSDPDLERAEFTINLLNLNCRRLCRLRKDMLEAGYRCIAELKDDSVALGYFLELELGEINGKLPSFFTARQQHFSFFVIYP
jgi:uncharacterized protein (TIGR02646 family)